MEEYVILVNENDEQIGLMEKLEAHQKGVLHRAFSILIFNDTGQMLIHQRAKEKYHCGNLWTNACCSHQRENESTINAANRRLQEEMGFKTSLFEAHSFMYETKFDNGLTEKEFDHILIGIYNENPIPNPDEVKDFKYVEIEWLKNDIHQNPDTYTSWFKIIVKEHLDKITIVQ